MKMLVCRTSFRRTGRRSAPACRCLPFDSLDKSFGLLADEP